MEEGQLKRALAMRLDKESKQNIRRQKKKDMKEQHVQDVLGYLFVQRKEFLILHQPKRRGAFSKPNVFFRQCNQIHQKREEMAERIQEITGETQQLKAKIQSLRDVCSKETERAQVGPPPVHEHVPVPVQRGNTAVRLCTGSL